MSALAAEADIKERLKTPKEGRWALTALGVNGLQTVSPNVVF
jgi:hypothetical protein